MESVDNILPILTNALLPIYSTGEPNQPITLYQGSLKLTQENTSSEGHGIVVFQWLPSPNINFEFTTNNNLLFEPEFTKTHLNLLELATSVEVSVSSISARFFDKQTISGSLVKPVKLISEKTISYIIFHLTNFHNFSGTWISTKNHNWRGRLLLEADGWNVWIDRLENIKDIIKSLELKGGYAITHVGKLERSDKKPFTTEEAENFLEALRRFLTFSRGFWTAPIPLIGYDSTEKKIYEEWSSSIIKPWQKVKSWFADSQDAESLTNLFPGFLRRWLNNVWNEPLKLAIHWYLESNAQAGGVQGSIILMQAAFELLAWTLLVDEKKIISQDGFEKLPAADKLRILLSQCNIPLEVPNSLTNLSKVVREYNWVDGAQAFTEIRNALVHSNPKKRQKLLINRDFLEQVEAYELGLWYLELVLLNLFEYKGDYFNRIAKKQMYRDSIEAVPWS